MSDAAAGRAKTSLQQHALNELRDLLTGGGVIPGQTLSIRKVAAWLGTSPTPVREAIATLVAMKALTEEAQGAARVPVLDAAQIAEIYELREWMELRALRGAVARMTPELAARLAEINDRLQTPGLFERDMSAGLKVNREFHFAIYRAAGSEVQFSLIEALWLRIGPTLSFSQARVESAFAREQHAVMLAAMVAGDAEAAGAALRAELHAVRDKLIERATGDASPMRMLL